LIEQAGTARASLVIVAIPEADRAQLAVLAARRLQPQVPILGRAHEASHLEALQRAGTTEVVQPELEASAMLIRRALHYLKLSEDRAAAYLEGFARR
jgi:CPA2 family monovalent cation:H+ antiporter-2